MVEIRQSVDRVCQIDLTSDQRPSVVRPSSDPILYGEAVAVLRFTFDCLQPGIERKIWLRTSLTKCDLCCCDNADEAD